MKKFYLFVAISIGLSISVSAQNVLDRVLSVDIVSSSVEKSLKIISNKGNFYFSYNSHILPKGKLISYSGTNKSIQEILDVILDRRYKYSQINNYIILKPSAKVVQQQTATQEKIYTIEGYVTEALTRERLSNVSILEKNKLITSLTNRDGYFKLKLKGNYKKLHLLVSRDNYEDTSIIIQPKFNHKLDIFLVPLVVENDLATITPEDYLQPDTITLQTPDTIPTYHSKSDSPRNVMRTSMGNLLLSTRQKIQSLNLKNFFTSRPVQVSLIPGLSTRGKISSQVINNFSFNIIGGYTGGVNGAEIGGVFNINQQSVKYAQVAGVFNITGGSMSGVQIAGVNNTVLESVNGVQLAGVNNYAREKVNGMQVAAVGNLSNREMNGLQVAGLFNYAKILHGVQIGLINIADSSDGFSIGLVNIIKKGYHKLAITTNETQQLNLAFKTGNHKLYSILTIGASGYKNHPKSYAFGYGLGTERSITKWFSVNPELTAQYLYLGNIFDANLLNKFQLDFHLNLGKHFSIFGGPSFSAWYSNQEFAIPGYQSVLPEENYKTHRIANNWRSWIGWGAGISFF